jgi:anion-transporting  ArsA/GET3 family ATPase
LLRLVVEKRCVRGSLFDRRFVIVAGKGGVGKSTMAAALALCASRRKKRVLVVELASKEKAAALFGHPEPVGYNVVRVAPDIDVINITPDEALHEYGLMKLKFERVYKAVFQNPIMKSLTRMIPGMNELTMIGKAWHLEQERLPDGRPRWDIIIVDAPATGHGISLLVLPHVVTETVKSGPMYEETRLIRDMLMDPDRTVMSIVTLPEEMPVNETIDLSRQLKETLRIEPGLLFVNGVWPAPPSAPELAQLNTYAAGLTADPAQAALMETTRFMVDRARSQQIYIEKLEERVPMSQIQIPYQFVPEWDFDAIDAIARRLDPLPGLA